MLEKKSKALKEMLKKQKDIKDVKITCGENEAKLLLGRCQGHQESPSYLGSHRLQDLQELPLMSSSVVIFKISRMFSLNLKPGIRLDIKKEQVKTHANLLKV